MGLGEADHQAARHPCPQEQDRLVAERELAALPAVLDETSSIHLEVAHRGGGHQVDRGRVVVRHRGLGAQLGRLGQQGAQRPVCSRIIGAMFLAIGEAHPGHPNAVGAVGVVVEERAEGEQAVDAAEAPGVLAAADPAVRGVRRPAAIPDDAVLDQFRAHQALAGHGLHGVAHERGHMSDRASGPRLAIARRSPKPTSTRRRLTTGRQRAACVGTTPEQRRAPAPARPAAPRTPHRRP